MSAKPFQGAVYVFVKPASGWANATQTAVLTASDGDASDGVGSTVSVSGDTLVAGPAQHQIRKNFRQGEAYVFAKPATGWANATESVRLQASDGVANDGLGRSVAISGDTVVVGAAGHQVGTNLGQGPAYIYLEPNTGWGTTGPLANQNVELSASDGAANDQFGTAVATTGAMVAVGAPAHQVVLTHRGAAYVFVKPLFGWPNTTTQTAVSRTRKLRLGRYPPAITATDDLAGAAPHARPVSTRIAGGPPVRRRASSVVVHLRCRLAMLTVLKLLDR